MRRNVACTSNNVVSTHSVQTQRSKLGILLAVLCFGFGVPIPASALTDAEVTAWLSVTDRLQRVTAPTESSRHYVRVKQSPAEGYVDATFADHGFLADGQEVFIVPLESGGSGGVFYTLLFTRVDGVRRFVGYIPSESGHLDVHIEEGQLRVTTPIYATSDAQCCPSHHRVLTYTLQGIQLKKLDEYVGR